MMSVRRRRVAAWMVCAAAPGLAAVPALARMGDPAAVTVDAVRLESVQQHRRVTGELRAVRSSRVATREAGLVIEMSVREGTRVRAGDVLARLDDSLLQLELKRAEANAAAAAAIVDERDATLSWRERELELYTQSARRGAANVKEVLDAESTTTIARARVLQARRLVGVAEARVELLRKRLSDMVVRAPFDGIVLARGAELGEWVGEGDDLAQLVSIGEIEAWLDIPQRYFGAVTERRIEVMISIDATRVTAGSENMRVIPRVDRRSRSFVVVVTLDDHDGALTPGMSLTAWVPTGGRTDRLTVSKDAVLRNDAGAFVYVARGGKAVPATVQVRFPVADRVVIESSGLHAGDLVVVEGNERLFPGALILAHRRGDVDSIETIREPR
ncbi:MAG: efflux RND transporter periplasmic adaptor subunit [Planctomycetes bacterium]|nr:efflux RND transporter periplasmic adaptor subunit [Planctomycetota bacterium]